HILEWSSAKFLVLPVITLSMIPVGILSRTTRAAVAEVHNQDFVQTLRAKGLSEWAVTRHVLKNSLPQVLAVMGLQFGYLLGGSILVETVFTWPGSGFLLSKAIINRDVPVLQGTILTLSLLIVLAALFAPWIAPFDPYKESIVGRLKPFGWRDHLLGTDELGRDMLSRILYGGRVSLLMGVVPVLIASLIGGLLGIVGGFVGGRVNTAIMRAMDVFYAFPSVLLAVAIAGAMGGG